jgi:hypothetical protein
MGVRVPQTREQRRHRFCFFHLAAIAYTNKKKPLLLATAEE